MVENGNNAPAPTWISACLKVQKFFSILFALGALLFPPFTLYQHGLNVLPVYDRVGNVIGHANYFILSLLVSAIMFAMSWLAYWATNKVLGAQNAQRRSAT